MTTAEKVLLGPLMWLSACVGATDTVEEPEQGQPDGLTWTGRVLGDQGASSPPLAGAGVALVDDEGTVLDETETDAVGNFSLVAAENSLAFLRVAPFTGYAGQLRAQQSREGDRFYDVRLQNAADLARSYDAVGLQVDPARGLMAVGFNPVTQDAGGEGARLEPPALHDPAFAVLAGTSVVSDVLPPLCPNEGPVPCTDLPRADQIFIPNVEVGDHAVSLVQPADGSCAIRFPVARWPIAPDTTTIVDVDCAP